MTGQQDRSRPVTGRRNRRALAGPMAVIALVGVALTVLSSLADRRLYHYIPVSPRSKRSQRGRASAPAVRRAATKFSITVTMNILSADHLAELVGRVEPRAHVGAEPSDGLVGVGDEGLRFLDAPPAVHD